MSEQVTVSKGDDVRVIPAELAKRYQERGWKKTTSTPKPAKSPDQS